MSTSAVQQQLDNHEESGAKRKAVESTNSTLEEGQRPNKTPKQQGTTTQPDATATPQVSPDGLKSPYRLRWEAFQRFKGEQDTVLHVSRPLQMLSESRQIELGYDEGDEDDEDERSEQDRARYEAMLDQLTAEEVDRLVRVIIIPIEVYNKQLELEDQLIHANERIQRTTLEERHVIDTSSTSYPMYSVIDKMLSGAQRLVNKAMKTCSTSAPTTPMPNGALEAFGAAFPAIYNVHHWRLDTEDSEQIDKFVKRIIKMIKDLLWFEDAELGLSDPYSRDGLLHYFNDLYKDWLGNHVKMSYIVASNGHGRGRLHVKPRAPPAAPKPAAAGSVAVAHAVAPTVASSNNTAAIQAYLNALGARLDERTKTVLQLCVVDVQTKKKASVVLSGATHLKKLSEVVAYLTGCSSEVSYHSQKGKCLKDSRLEVILDANTMWFTDKTDVKKAPAGLAVHDKDIKVVQIFQGIAKNNSSGIVYDSEQAKTISLFWVSPAGKRFQIQAEAIVPVKFTGKPVAMPRLVHPDYNNSHVRNGFGVYLRKANNILLSGRELPKFFAFGGVSKAEMKKWGSSAMCRPLCDEQGHTDLLNF
eukprot:scaffold15108_cov180-Amphora_coffeaeformis.AAC.3